MVAFEGGLFPAVGQRRINKKKVAKGLKLISRRRISSKIWRHRSKYANLLYGTYIFVYVVLKTPQPKYILN